MDVTGQSDRPGHQPEHQAELAPPNGDERSRSGSIPGRLFGTGSSLASGPVSPGQTLTPPENHDSPERRAERERIRTFERRVELLRESGLPKRALAVKPAFDFAPWHSVYSTTYAAVSDGGAVMLTGPRGTGKTCIAALVARNRCVLAGVVPLYYRLADLCATFKHQCFGEGESEDVFLNRLGRVGLLIIDEVQDRYGSETEDLVLTRVFDRRYAGLMPTILIANLEPEQIAGEVGASIVDRLHECGQVIACEWGSLR